MESLGTVILVATAVIAIIKIFGSILNPMGGSKFSSAIITIATGGILYLLVTGKVFELSKKLADTLSGELLGDSSDSGNQSSGASQSSAPIETPAPVPSPAPVTQTENAQFDPTFIWTALSVIGLLVVVALVAFGATHLTRWQLKKNKVAKSASERIANVLSQASEKISKTLLASAAYETNLAKQIEFPLMTDVTQTAVSLYVKNMRLALAARDALPANPSIEAAQDYLTAATNFEVTFNAAEDWATKMKWSTFSVAEHRRLNDAKVSLALLEDHTTSPDQRNALYKRLEKLLTGLISITEPVKMSLSSKVPMLALESAKA